MLSHVFQHPNGGPITRTSAQGWLWSTFGMRTRTDRPAWSFTTPAPRSPMTSPISSVGTHTLTVTTAPRAYNPAFPFRPASRRTAAVVCAFCLSPPLAPELAKAATPPASSTFEPGSAMVPAVSGCCGGYSEAEGVPTTSPHAAHSECHHLSATTPQPTNGSSWAGT